MLVSYLLLYIFIVFLCRLLHKTCEYVINSFAPICNYLLWKRFVIFCNNQGTKDYLLPLRFGKLAKKSITILHNQELDTKLFVNLSNSTLRSVSNMSFLLLLIREQTTTQQTEDDLSHVFVKAYLIYSWYSQWFICMHRKSWKE